MFTQRKKQNQIELLEVTKRFKPNTQTNLDYLIKPKKKINLELEDENNQEKIKSQQDHQQSHLFKKPKNKNLKNFFKLDLSTFIEDDIINQEKQFKIKEKKKFIQSEKKPNFEAKFVINQDNLYMPYEPYSYQSQSVFLLSKAIYQNQKAIMFESPTGTGKTQTILTTLLGYIKNKQVFKSKEHKILYFTRTVSQMNQVIDETKKSAYNVIATILSSRVSLCLNKDVNNNKNNNFQMINKCLDLQKTNSCMYKIDPLKPNKNYHIYNNVCDIEDLKEIGQTKSQCAYYFSKKMSEICDVVVLSYSYLVESIYRDSITNLVENNFIVFDEAHNIAKVLEQASSWELKLEDFHRILRELNFLMQTAELKKREGDVCNGVVNLCEKATILITKIQKNFENFIKNQKQEFYCGSYIIQLFSLDRVTTKISFQRLRDFIKEEKLKNILAKFLNIYQDMQDIFKRSKQDFKSFKLFINTKNEINFICLDAKIGFNNIMKLNPKQIILASGTLSPFDILEKQLGYDFDVKFSIEPDLDQWVHSLAVMKINNFFDFHQSNSITFNYNSRSDKTLLTSFLKFLVFVSQLVPQGILIFLPSYQILESYKNVIVANKELRRELENEKQIFFESKSPEVNAQFQQYQKACQNKGACFFLVFRGKYSEGLDFKDELARLVMIIGIPFGNVGDIKLKAKREYLKELKEQNKKDKEILNYQDWYINEAFVQINQAAGRIKRNQKDFGLVFLVDSRYSHFKYKQFISNHLHKLEKEIQQKNKFKNFIKKFFEFNLPQKMTRKKTKKQIQKQKDKNVIQQLFKKCQQQIEKEENIHKKQDQMVIKDYKCKFCNLESNDADQFQISNCDHLICQGCYDKKENPKCKICKIKLMKNLIKQLQLQLMNTKKLSLQIQLQIKEYLKEYVPYFENQIELYEKVEILSEQIKNIQTKFHTVKQCVQKAVKFFGAFEQQLLDISDKVLQIEVNHNNNFIQKFNHFQNQYYNQQTDLKDKIITLQNQQYNFENSIKQQKQFFEQNQIQKDNELKQYINQQIQLHNQKQVNYQNPSSVYDNNQSELLHSIELKLNDKLLNFKEDIQNKMQKLHKLIQIYGEKQNLMQSTFLSNNVRTKSVQSISETKKQKNQNGKIRKKINISQILKKR